MIKFQDDYDILNLCKFWKIITWAQIKVIEKSKLSEINCMNWWFTIPILFQISTSGVGARLRCDPVKQGTKIIPQFQFLKNRLTLWFNQTDLIRLIIRVVQAMPFYFINQCRKESDPNWVTSSSIDFEPIEIWVTMQNSVTF